MQSLNMFGLDNGLSSCTASALREAPEGGPE
ncbi:MAG: hypothetical protein QOF67_1850 [Mycobacterium sp.]|nr:hypothetical protein [Mycobacterium sp.]